MKPQMIRGIPNPAFAVKIQTIEYLRLLIVWLSGLDFDNMTLNLDESTYTFQTAQERLFFAFGLEKTLEIFSSGSLDLDRI